MNRTMTDEEVLRAAVSNLAIDDPTWTMEEARAIMRDSGICITPATHDEDVRRANGHDWVDIEGNPCPGNKSWSQQLKEKRDSGEHDTLDDQIAHEQEHGTREFRLAIDLWGTIGKMITKQIDAGLPVPREWLRAVDQGYALCRALAPRPTITPAGSIDDVEWRDEDQ